MNEVITPEKQEIIDKLKSFYPMLEPALMREIANNSLIRDFSAGEILMKPGQFFKSTMLITKGRVKVYKEGEQGSEFFMYYLEPGNACALSMICAALVLKIIKRPQENKTNVQKNEKINKKLNK